MSTHAANGSTGRARPLDASALGELFNRLPPHSPEAEMALLGSVLLDPHVLTEVHAIIRAPEDFYSPAHAAIYRALVRLYDQRQSGDLVQLVEALRGDDELDRVGGGEYLVRLAEAVPSAANAAHYARIVADKARLRRLIDAAGQIVHSAYHAGSLGVDGAREVIDRAESAIFSIAEDQETLEPDKLAELLMREIERIEALEGKGISGIATGFADLDHMLSGLQPGELVIVAGRPSMGKTALALNLAEQVALGGLTPWQARGDVRTLPVGFFSLEMSRASVAQRLLSANAGVDSHRMRTGHVNQREFDSLKEAADRLSTLPIYIDDSPSLTSLALRARARRMVARHQVRALFVDYLQLLSGPADSRESRQVEVSAISRSIKALARELKIPVVCLAQLNRAAELREGNRPRMSDLRESGSIEQDADVIILIHREEYYHVHNPDWAEENPDKAGVTELIVAKQRNGPTGVVKLTWDARTTRFQNHTYRHDPDAEAVHAQRTSAVHKGYQPRPKPPAEPKPLTGPENPNRYGSDVEDRAEPFERDEHAPF